MSVGEGLRTLRKEMGKSIRIVAGLAGVSYGNLCDIENDKQSPYIYTVKGIAESTGMDLHRLAHFAFDLDPPEKMELRGRIKELCDIVIGFSEDEQALLLALVKFYIDQILGGGGDLDKSQASQAGHG